MRLLLSTLLLLLTTATHSYAVDTFQNNQVVQMTGQKYHIYNPTERIRIRQGPSLDTKQIGLITDENEKSYIYKPHNSKWLSVSTLEGKLVGYSYEELFYKRPVAVLKDEIKTAKGVYRLEFTGYEFDPTKDSYNQLQYYYQVFLNDEEIFTKGSKTRFQSIQPRVAGNGDEEMAVQFHSLTIQGKKIGWLFGWNKHEDYDDTWKDLDFSFGRVIIPDANSDKLFTESYQGMKFAAIADHLDKAENQLLITPVEEHMLSCYPCRGFYYLPSAVMITSKKDQGLSVKTSAKITINDRFIESNPEYAYAIAVNIDDYDSMRKASNLFMDKIENASQLCASYDYDITDYALGRYVYLKYRWDREARELFTSAANCLGIAGGSEFAWHAFYRTGLFPTKKTIDTYIKNRYVYVNF